MPIYVERAQSSAVRSSFVGLPSLQEIDAFHAWGLRLMKQRRPHVVVMDIRRAPTPPITHLRSHASWISEHAETIRTQLLGVIFVADSPMLRGALKAMFYLQPMPTKTVVARDLETAVRALQPLLADHGIADHIPPFADDPAESGERLEP